LEVVVVEQIHHARQNKFQTISKNIILTVNVQNTFSKKVVLHENVLNRQSNFSRQNGIMQLSRKHQKQRFVSRP